MNTNKKRKVSDDAHSNEQITTSSKKQEYCFNPNCFLREKKHSHRDRSEVYEPKLLDTIMQHVGNTPIVRINKIAKKANLQCELLAKCEFFNAGGSIKDRIGKRMVEDAMNSGRIKPGDTLIEPTSGNTGIGLALAAAIYGFRMIITLPEKMSQEKVDVLKALGAEIIRTPTEAAWDSPESHIGVAKRLNQEIPNSHILDQYSNPSNPLAHYDQTAEEIIEACGQVDMIVIGAGTGGTITGVGAKIKEKYPKCIVVGVDPIGSILAQPEELNDEKRLQSYQVEGIGYDFIPNVLHRNIVDRWIKMGDRDSFIMARRMIREEGLLCGGSCGTALAAAIIAAKDLKKGQKCVVILPDSTRNYMTKFLSDQWMIDHEYVVKQDDKLPSINMWWAKKKVIDLPLQSPCTVSPDVSCQEAIAFMNKQGYDNLPVVSKDNSILGVVSEGNLTALITSQRVASKDPISKAMYTKFHSVTPHTSLNELSRIFDKEHFAFVISPQTCLSSGGIKDIKNIIFGIVTRIDLLSYITNTKETT